MKQSWIAENGYIWPVSGFSYPEGTDGKKWFWAINNHATMGIHNPSDKPIVFSVTFSLVALDETRNKHVDIYLDDLKIQSVLLPDRYNVYIELNSNETRHLGFKTEGKLDKAPGDDERHMAFCFADIQCEIETPYERSEELIGIQNCLYELFEQVDDICRRHDIKYTAFYGTMLGAVRHHGIIPWDDDIDIAMTRDNYDRFVEAAGNELKEPFFLQTPQSDRECFFGGYAKVRNSNTTAIVPINKDKRCNEGIWIDILPLDKVFLDPGKQKAQMTNVMYYQYAMFCKVYGMQEWIKDRVSDIDYEKAYALSLEMSYDELWDRLEYHLKSAQAEEAFLYTPLARFMDKGKRKFYGQDDFNKLKDVPFGRRRIGIPENICHAACLHVGKSFMTYPPKVRRKSGHHILWDVNKPYQEYKDIDFKKRQQVIAVGINDDAEQYYAGHFLSYDFVYAVDDRDELCGSMWHDAIVISTDTFQKLDLNGYIVKEFK